MKEMKKIRFSVLCLMSALCFSSCSHRLVDFTVISSKNIPITEEGGQFKKADKRVVGKDSKWSILFVAGIPDMKEAIDRAIEQYPGAVALTDGVIYSKGWSCGLFGQNQYVVEGTPLYSPSLYNSNNGNFQYSNVQGNFNQSGNMNQRQHIIETVQQPVQQVSQSSQSQSSMVRLIHVVDKNEKLMNIADAYKVSVVDIMKWNNLETNNVYTGMKLTIYVSM